MPSLYAILERIFGVFSGNLIFQAVILLKKVSCFHFSAACNEFFQFRFLTSWNGVKKQ